ncbi:hypothetical protein B0H11DRAFT_1912193 [Mycena galericulata]|nr:hypothetical protein B0H11DRAFT_1912193 [Mycena galericulata]
MSNRTSRVSKKVSERSAVQELIKGKKAKQPLVSPYIDDEAEESDGRTMSDDGGEHTYAVFGRPLLHTPYGCTGAGSEFEEEDLESTPPPNSVRRVRTSAKGKGKAAKRYRKRIVEAEVSSEEDLSAMADDDRRNKRNQLEADVAPSGSTSKKVKSSSGRPRNNQAVTMSDMQRFVTTLVTDLLKPGIRNEGLVADPGIDDQKAMVGSGAVTKTARIVSPSPDVEDPIDYESAQISQAIADSIASAQANKRGTGGQGSSSRVDALRVVGDKGAALISEERILE